MDSKICMNVLRKSPIPDQNLERRNMTLGLYRIRFNLELRIYNLNSLSKLYYDFENFYQTVV